MNGIEDYGQEKVKKGLFDKDEKEQVLDHLIYKYQEPHNILLEIIKDKQSGTADKLISSKKFGIFHFISFHLIIYQMNFNYPFYFLIFFNFN